MAYLEKSEIKNNSQYIPVINFEKSENGYFCHQKSETRNQKSGIRNQKSEIGNQKSETRNPKPETWNQKSEISNQKSEIRNPKSETRNQKSETRNQKSEIRNQKSEIRNQKSEIRNQKSETRNQKPEIRNQKSETWNLKSEIRNPKPVVRRREWSGVVVGGEGRGGEGRGGEGRGGEGEGRGGEGRGRCLWCDGFPREELLSLGQGWGRVCRNSFDKGEGGGVGVRGWGTSVHFPNCQGRYRLKKVETTIKALLLGKTLPWNGFTVFANRGTAVQFLRYLNSRHDNIKFTTEGWGVRGEGWGARGERVGVERWE